MDGIDFAIYLADALILIAALAAVLLPLIKSLDDIKSLMIPVGGLVGLLVIFGIGWALSGSEVTPVYEEFGVDASGSKQIGGMLTAMYILIGASVVGIIASEIKQLFFK